VEAAAVDTVPSRLYPLAAQDSEDDHERMEKIAEVPARYLIGKVQLIVVASEHLPTDTSLSAISLSNCMLHSNSNWFYTYSVGAVLLYRYDYEHFSSMNCIQG